MGGVFLIINRVPTGASVNEKNKKGMNALTAASIKGHKEIVQASSGTGSPQVHLMSEDALAVPD